MLKKGVTKKDLLMKGLKSKILARSSTNKPPDGQFYQQSWTYCNSKFGTPLMYLIVLVYAAICASIGITVTIFAVKVEEVIIYYPDCKICNTCTCTARFTLKRPLKKYASKIFLYYGMTNFYQNHFKYLMSFDENELYGKPKESSGCGVFNHLNNTRVAPCGKVARSLFNDTYVIRDHLNKSIVISMKNIALSTDSRMFGEPPDSFWKTTIKPDTWAKSPKERSSNPFTTDEAFQVWMKIASFQKFVKLYGSINTSSPKRGLSAGDYTIHINNRYPVSSINRKFIMISNTSNFGSKNIIMGIIPFVCSALYILLGIGGIFMFRLSRVNDSTVIVETNPDVKNISTCL